MPFSHLPACLSAWLSQFGDVLDRRSAPRLLLLLVGALFAHGRRTVTSWFRAAGITDAFRPAYGALWAIGRRSAWLALRLLLYVVRPLMLRLPSTRLLFGIDDTPTAR
jgi:hypothetical protein